MPAADLTAGSTDVCDAATGHWQQLLLTTAQPADLEPLLIDLAPLLHKIGQNGPEYWWIRKAATLRLRLADPRPDDVTRITEAARHHNVTVHTGVYEPETHAFGGNAGIGIAHRMACHDSHHVAGHLARHGHHELRHELFLLLATRLLRAADLDLEEQGDVWARVAAHRPAPDSVPAPTRRAVRHLIFSGPDEPSSPLHHTPAWSAGLESGGRDLAALAATGQLTRGLRAILANLLLFMANRHGISSRPLAVLSTTAQHIIFQEDHHHMAPTTEAPAAPLDPVTLQNQLADIVRARKAFSPDGPVEHAFRTVFRHEFVPAAPLEDAYAPRPVITKRAADGSALSSASAPALVARMLEQLAAQPGENILEIGAATGYNAALIAEIVGPNGRVVTIEYDQDLTNGAIESIERTGYADRVEVRCSDGAYGAPDRAPFDAIIVTVGAIDLPQHWWDQLTDNGRMIVPLELHPCGLTRSLRLHRTGPDTAVSTQQLVCGFVPMRGHAAAEATRSRLADDILLDHAPTDDTIGLSQAVAAGPSWQQWTGLTFSQTPLSVLHLDLWLATQQPIPFGRLSLSNDVRESGIANPARRWSGATLFRDGSLAYLTTRDVADGEEIGIAAHGPAAEQLGHELLDLTRTWHAGPRLHEPTITATRSSNDIDLTVRW